MTGDQSMNQGTYAFATGHRCTGAAIADALTVNQKVAPANVDVVHNIDPDEWYVTVDGRRVLTFSGPSAWTMALSHQAELSQMLTDDSARQPASRR
jgi:hypothetical protein